MELASQAVSSDIKPYVMDNFKMWILKHLLVRTLTETSFEPTEPSFPFLVGLFNDVCIEEYR